MWLVKGKLKLHTKLFFAILTGCGVLLKERTSILAQKEQAFSTVRNSTLSKQSSEWQDTHQAAGRVMPEQQQQQLVNSKDVKLQVPRAHLVGATYLVGAVKLEQTGAKFQKHCDLYKRPLKCSVLASLLDIKNMDKIWSPLSPPWCIPPIKYTSICSENWATWKTFRQENFRWKQM